MKRLSVKHAYLFFGILIGGMLMLFIGLCKQVRREQQVERTKFNDIKASNVAINSDSIAHPEWYRMTNAGVIHMDSVAFEYLASLATAVDLPEELPVTGDTVCAYVLHDTVFIQHWHANKLSNYEYQRKMFRFVYNQ